MTFPNDWIPSVDIDRVLELREKYGWNRKRHDYSSPREEQASELLDKGASIEEICLLLGVEDQTVRLYLRKSGRLEPSKKAARRPIQSGEIYRLRSEGWSLKDIGKRFRLSSTAVRVRFEKERMRRESAEKGHICRELSVRTENCVRWKLYHEGLLKADEEIFTPDLVGKLDPKSLLKSSNFGRLSLLELTKWMAAHGHPNWGLETNSKAAETYANYLRRHGWTVLPPKK